MHTLTKLKKDELISKISEERQEEWDRFRASWAKRGMPLPDGSLISGVLDIGFKSVGRLIDELFETEKAVLSKQPGVPPEYFNGLAEEFGNIVRQEIGIIRSEALGLSGIPRVVSSNIILTLGKKEASIRDSINRRFQILKEELELGVVEPLRAGQIEKKAQSKGANMNEDKKTGRFIYVTVDEPQQRTRNFTFFTDVSSGSILTESAALSGVYLPPAEYERLMETLDRRREEKTDGILAETVLDKAGKTVRVTVTQSKTQIKIFICYAQEDIDQARQIYMRLEDEGYDPWIDKEKLVGGQDWELEIAKAIEESSFFLACLSSNSVNKEGYVQRELKKGMDVLERQPEGRIYLIPVKLEDCQVPFKLGKWQWVDLFETDGMERLLKAIERGCEQRKLGVRHD